MEEIEKKIKAQSDQIEIAEEAYSLDEDGEEEGDNFDIKLLDVSVDE